MAGTMDRRSFLKVTGTTTAGLAGILASGRAPAYAQGQKLHMVRWVDFVPAADEALKKQAVEAGKLLGAEITIETINANDIQARITAAISSGSRRRHLPPAAQFGAPLREEPDRRRGHRGRDRKGAGRLLSGR